VRQAGCDDWPSRGDVTGPPCGGSICASID